MVNTRVVLARADCRGRNRQKTACPYRVWLLASALFSSVASAQLDVSIPDAQLYVQELTTISSQIEVLASACLSQAGPSSRACSDFLAAIDGDPGANYARACEQLRGWRSALIAQRFRNTAAASDAETSEQANAARSEGSSPALELELMIATEALCDNGSWLANNENVVAAFAQATSTSAALPTRSSAFDAAAVARLFRQQQNDSLQQQERLRQRQQIEKEQQRILQRSEQANRNLEAELLRQQLRRQPQR